MALHYRRLGLCWIPRVGTPLSVFGVRWTGWCSDFDYAYPQDIVLKCVPDYAEIIGDTCYPGLHAPLQLPFALEKTQNFWALMNDIETITAKIPAITLPPLKLAVMDNCVVLTCMCPNTMQLQLRRKIAQAIAPHISKKTKNTLQERENKDFYMPLSKAISPWLAQAIIEELQPHIGNCLKNTYLLDDLALVGEIGSSRQWQIVERFALDGSELSDRNDGLSCHGPHLLTAIENLR